MLNCVDLSIHNLGQSAIDGQDRAVFYAFGHAVTDHAGTDGIGVVDFQGVEVAAGQSDGLAGIFHNMGLAGAWGGSSFLVEGELNVGGLKDRINATNGLCVEGIAGFIVQAQVPGVFRAIACFQPFTINGQFSGDFLHVMGGHAAGVPVMDILRGRVQEFGKPCCRDVRYSKECFESWAASVLFHEDESTGAAKGFE